MPRKKIALIGGGQVGGNIALLAAQKELGDIVIIDIPEAENFVKGKALDISQLLPHDGFDCQLSGSSDFKAIKKNSLVILEHARKKKIVIPKEFEIIKEKNYGNSGLILIKLK